MKEYIDKESTLQDLEDILNDPNCPLFIAATVDQVISLKEAANVREVVPGGWEAFRENDPEGPTRCVACGRVFPVEYSDYEFCPRCGAEARKEARKMGGTRYVYGMRLRGFSPGCQPMAGFVERWDATQGKYHDLLVYDRMLSKEEKRDYELDFLQVVE